MCLELNAADTDTDRKVSGTQAHPVAVTVLYVDMKSLI